MPPPSPHRRYLNSSWCRSPGLQSVGDGGANFHPLAANSTPIQAAIFGPIFDALGGDVATAIWPGRACTLRVQWKNDGAISQSAAAAFINLLITWPFSFFLFFSLFICYYYHFFFFVILWMCSLRSHFFCLLFWHVVERFIIDAAALHLFICIRHFRPIRFQIIEIASTWMGFFFTSNRIELQHEFELH